MASIDRTADVAFEGAADNQERRDGFSFAWDRQQSAMPDAVKDTEETAAERRAHRWATAGGGSTSDARQRRQLDLYTPPRPIRHRPAARCVVPDLRGKSGPQGRGFPRRCTRFGLVTSSYSESVPAGRIMRQSRRPGTRLRLGAKVNVAVSRGRRR